MFKEASHWYGRCCLALVLVLVSLGTIARSSPVQGQLPGSIFWDGFETGDLLHWEGVDIPGGGSIEFPPGSLAPGTQVTVTPVATPTLPADIEALGQSYEITFVPDLLDPVILRLPLPKGEDPADVWIIDVEQDDSVTVYETEFVAARYAGSPVDGPKVIGYTGIAGLVWSVNAIETARFYDPDNYLPRITSSDVLPAQGRIGEVFEATLAWEGEPSDIDFEWSLSGPTETYGGSLAPGMMSRDHSYIDHGRKRVTIRARRDGTGPGRSLAFHSIVVESTIPTVMSSTSGTITWKDPDGDNWVGEYNPGQDGVIRGALDGQVLTGHWIENLSALPCKSEMPDRTGTKSIYWGKMEFTFSDDFLTFCGRWSRCDNDFGTSWWRGWVSGQSSPVCPLP